MSHSIRRSAAALTISAATTLALTSFGAAAQTGQRLRRLIDRYGGVGYDERALWLLGRAYVKVDMPDRAREAWTQLVSKFPKSSQAGDAQRAIARLPAAAAPKPQ